LPARAGAWILSGLIAVPGFALAAQNPAAGTSSAAVPELHSSEGIAFATGGISPDEAAAYRAQANQYPLSLELIEKQAGDKKIDEFTAEARVQIKRGTDTVFDAEAAGPFMLVRMDPGVYSITATLGNQTLQKTNVHVAAGKTTREILEFPVGTD
jgi:hypothetical protein